MDKKEYNEVKEIVKDKYSRTFRRYGERYEDKIGIDFWASINNNEDIESLKNSIEEKLGYYENINCNLMCEDIDNLEVQLGKYEKALSKIIRCYNNRYCDFDYSFDELMELIDNLSLYEKRLSTLRKLN